MPSEHRYYHHEKVFKKPFFHTNYLKDRKDEKDNKTFFIKLDEDGKTVLVAKILVPKDGKLLVYHRGSTGRMC